jgi:single-strand DNA-binding protein
MNRVFLIGSVAFDPELRHTKNGQPILNLRVRTTKKWSDASGAPRERSDTHSVVFWGKRSEELVGVLAKGVSVIVEGELQNSSYEKDGQKVWKTEVNATNIDLVSETTPARRDAYPGNVRQNDPIPFGAPMPAAPHVAPVQESDDIPY